MADKEDNAEKAYAAAAASSKPATKEPPAKAETPAPVAKEAEPAKTEEPVKPAPVKSAPASKASPAKKAAPAKKVAAKKAAGTKKVVTPAKAAAKKTTTRKTARPPAAKTAKSAPKAVAKKAAKASVKESFSNHTVTELKEKIMATAKTDMTATMTEAMKEMQTKAKDTYDKTTAMATEFGDLAKGNVEAFVESGKILSTGMQDMGKTYVDEAKSAYETFTADVKEMAAVKSPTELFQLQGKIMRRNFDALVSTSSKNSEAMMKLANDAFAPISGRVSVATEKLAKVA